MHRTPLLRIMVVIRIHPADAETNEEEDDDESERRECQITVLTNKQNMSITSRPTLSLTRPSSSSFDFEHRIGRRIAQRFFCGRRNCFVSLGLYALQPARSFSLEVRAARRHGSLKRHRSCRCQSLAGPRIGGKGTCGSNREDEELHGVFICLGRDSGLLHLEEAVFSSRSIAVGGDMLLPQRSLPRAMETMTGIWYHSRLDRRT
jgi:hypothetical protein